MRNLLFAIYPRFCAAANSEYKALQKRYRTILTQGARELPPIPPRQNGQRGKVAKSDAHNLWERMKNYETAVLRFAKHPDVAFTNNRAERALRGIALGRKSWLFCGSDRGGVRAAAMYTLIGTAKLNDVDPQA